MAVGRNHPHPIGAELPENPVQDRPALFGAGGECDMADELLEILGGPFQPPSNFTAGKAGNSSRGSPSSLNLERPHSIFTRCSPDGHHPDRPRWAARSRSRSASGRKSDRAFLIHRCRDDRADGNVEIGTGETKPVLGCLDQDVGQDRKRGLGRDAGSDRARPSCSCSRVIVNFIRSSAVLKINTVLYIKILVAVVEGLEMWSVPARRSMPRT